MFSLYSKIIKINKIFLYCIYIMNIVIKIIVIAVLVILFDSIYLYLIKDMFNKQIIDIQGSRLKINIYSVILCYMVIIFGLYYFIIKDHRSIFDAFLLGFVIYAIYELTNLALFKKWSVIIVIIDSLWGGILFALTTWTIKKIDG